MRAFRMPDRLLHAIERFSRARRLVAYGALLVVMGTAAVTAPTASAHTLSKSDAALSGRIELSEYADYLCNQESCDLATYPRMTKYDCFRSSRHVVRCSGTFELITYDTYSDYSEECSAMIKAR